MKKIIIIYIDNVENKITVENVTLSGLLFHCYLIVQTAQIFYLHI
jgi:hypothetical protein